MAHLNVRILAGDCVRFAKVTPQGALVVSKAEFDDASFKAMVVDNQVYNFYLPVVHRQLVITGMRLKADKDVSTSVTSTAIFYEADSATSTTVDKVLHQEALLKGDQASLFPMNLLVNEGKYVNGKVDDGGVHVTIFGYYTEVN